MTAILLGSISTIADTSELQRESFNRAFAEHGLDWEWSRDDYVGMLQSNGGKDRVAEYAASRGEDVDAEAVHRRKSELFQQGLADSGVAPREGVVEAVQAAREREMRVALVTTTSADNLAALATALQGQLDLDELDLLVDSSQVSEPKPDASSYTYALDQLGLSAEDCVAVEDNLGGVRAARSAGVPCVAFPNQNTREHDFSEASARRDRLDLQDLRSFIPSEAAAT